MILQSVVRLVPTRKIPGKFISDKNDKTSTLEIRRRVTRWSGKLGGQGRHLCQRCGRGTGVWGKGFSVYLLARGVSVNLWTPDAPRCGFSEQRVEIVERLRLEVV